MYKSVEETKAYCLALPGVSVEEKGPPGNLLSYSVGDKNNSKKFAWFKTSEPERWRFSFRVAPDLFLSLTGQPGIKPARYMARFHWVTVVRVESLNREQLCQLIDWSYRKALFSLPKKQQLTIKTEALLTIN